ncbi:MAG: hypothetical protein BWY66_00257 [bacterium ADurb.Bin374]|nr:MAG: hypothetical protein BWY66_00257 [bacterium ADurb.Bin374]
MAASIVAVPFMRPASSAIAVVQEALPDTNRSVCAEFIAVAAYEILTVATPFTGLYGRFCG